MKREISKETRIELLAQLAKDLLCKYQDAKETVIYEYSGDMKELKEFDDECERIWKRIAFLEKGGQDV